VIDLVDYQVRRRVILNGLTSEYQIATWPQPGTRNPLADNPIVKPTGSRS
jgi:hypothetical protein